MYKFYTSLKLIFTLGTLGHFISLSHKRELQKSSKNHKKCYKTDFAISQHYDVAIQRLVLAPLFSKLFCMLKNHAATLVMSKHCFLFLESLVPWVLAPRDASYNVEVKASMFSQCKPANLAILVPYSCCQSVFATSKARFTMCTVIVMHMCYT